LSGPYQDQPTGIQVIPGEAIFGGLALWLSLREPGLCFLSVEGQIIDHRIVPCLLTIPNNLKLCVTGGLISDEELCVFVGHPEPGSSVDPQPSELYVRNYGVSYELARHLIEQIKAWDKAGRPTSNSIRIKAYPFASNYLPSTDEFVIPKHWTRLIISWK
jgi:hypothetical protein